VSAKFFDVRLRVLAPDDFLNCFSHYNSCVLIGRGTSITAIEIDNHTRQHCATCLAEILKGGVSMSDNNAARPRFDFHGLRAMRGAVGCAVSFLSFSEERLGTQRQAR
jgi:hypothetical protein